MEKKRSKLPVKGISRGKGKIVGKRPSGNVKKGSLKAENAKGKPCLNDVRSEAAVSHGGEAKKGVLRKDFVEGFEKFDEYMEFKTLPVSAITPFAGNPRYMPQEGHRRLQRSMKTFKWTSPILLWRNPATDALEILAGHQRLSDACELGATRAPCIILKQFKSRAQAMAYVVADNQLSNLSDWDLPLLKDWVEELKGSGEIDLEETGFTPEELSRLFDSELPQWDPMDEVPPEDAEGHDKDVLASKILVKVNDADLYDEVREHIESLIQELWPEDVELM